MAVHRTPCTGHLVVHLLDLLNRTELDPAAQRAQLNLRGARRSDPLWQVLAQMHEDVT